MARSAGVTRLAATAWVAVLTVLVAAAGQGAARLSGRVLDPEGRPLPGATVTVDGPDGRRQAVTRDDGRFTFDGLVAGSHGVTAAFVGFLEAHREIAVAAGADQRLDVALGLAPLGVADHVAPTAAAAYAQADAVAHLRIEGAAAPGPCGDGGGILHRATVVSAAKGRLAPWIAFWQVDATSCRTAAGEVRASGAPYRPGDELLVFLVGPPPTYRSLAGPALALPLQDGRLVRGHGPLRAGMTVAEAWAAIAP